MDLNKLITHQIQAVAKAKIITAPFPHIYMQPFVPIEWYDTLLNDLPPPEWYEPLGGRDKRDDGTSTRDFFDLLNDDRNMGPQWLWGMMAQTMVHESFYKSLLFKFAEPLSRRFAMHKDNVHNIPVKRHDVRLFRDTIDYKLLPHTDAGSKAVTLQMYLPSDDKWENLGTSLYEMEYRSGSRDDRCYREVTRLPFRANSAYAFPILTADMDNPSWHGREKLTQPGVQRDTMIYNLYYR